MARQRTPTARSWLAAAWLGAACLAAACRSAAASDARSAKSVAPIQRTPDTVAPPEVREAAARRRRASGAVTVRLASLLERAELALVDSRGARHTVRRTGLRVQLDGQPAQSSIALHADESGPVGIEGIRLRGALRLSVEASGAWRIENDVDLEDYIVGVVARESGLACAQPEAWRAQAIAARSFALANLEQRGATRPDPYLFDGVRDQAYGGEPQARNAREAELVERLRAAVASTAGRVLVEGDRYVDARYHAACGGQTAEGRAVFPELRSNCMRGATCEPCAASAASSWRWTASKRDLDALVRARGLGERLVELRPTEQDASRRWLSVELVGDRGRKQLRFEELRRDLGRDKLRSARIRETWPKPGAELGGGLLLSGSGYGHGVGLCQRGALEYARRGWSAERILTHYYAGAAVEDRR